MYLLEFNEFFNLTIKQMNLFYLGDDTNQYEVNMNKQSYNILFNTNLHYRYTIIYYYRGLIYFSKKDLQE